MNNTVENLEALLILQHQRTARLIHSLQPLLSDAKDAVRKEPYFPDVALDRINSILRILSEYTK
jgi:hypothetical protein